MSAYMIVFIVSYSIMLLLAWLTFALWLHDNIDGFKDNWVLPICTGLCLATIWPLSLFGLYVAEEKLKKNISLTTMTTSSIIEP